MSNNNQKGFGLLIVIAAIAVVGIGSFAAMRVMNKTAISPVASSAPAVLPSKIPEKLQSPSDLQQASTALDATTVDSGVNPDQLDADLNSLQ